MAKDKTDEYGFPLNNSTGTDPTAAGKNYHLGAIIKTLMIVGFIIGSLISVIFAGYLSWHCYATDLKLVRVFKTVSACIFSLPYLVYFLFIRVLLKVPCY